MKYIVALALTFQAATVTAQIESPLQNTCQSGELDPDAPRCVEMAQNGKFNVTPPQPYTRADFERDCIRMAPTTEPARSKWIASCRKDAP